uniref:TLC domain-containing protein n=1 Tax=Chaetoceros debilis TaxID=122233 RepID=A0A7S3QJR7_9STRA|mmetsp:Transcript_18710/g.28405  ORF Transcript_18710/g.28405 Transcript_18710/m.28405 type:complete len:216 (+) Transcript_18710:98-745(+)
MENTDRERAVLPYLVTGCLFWQVFYAVSYIRRDGNERHFHSKRVSNFHSITGIIMSVANLCINNDSVFPESIILSWGIGYFLADLIDCIVRRDFMFAIHSILAITLLPFGWKGELYAKKAGSLAYFIEFSSPCYHKWLQSKKRSDFIVFIVTFFACRIIYVPIFFTLIGAEDNSFLMVGIILFYLLNIAWFTKASCLLFNYKDDMDSRESYETIA